MRRERKYHYIYKTTCNVTGRWYIGMHSTDDLDDGYIGSGKRLWFSINYHGKENHTKEIIEFCENRFELKKREAEIVNSDLIQETNCMNLKTGGDGGHGFWSEEHRQNFINSDGPKNFAKRVNEDKEFGDKIRKTLLNNVKKAHVDGKITPPDCTGRQHSDKTKQKMSEKAQQRIGDKNSQYGTCWITRDGLNKKVKKEDLETYLVEGWIKGRK